MFHRTMAAVVAAAALAIPVSASASVSYETYDPATQLLTLDVLNTTGQVFITSSDVHLQAVTAYSCRTRPYKVCFYTHPTQAWIDTSFCGYQNEPACPYLVWQPTYLGPTLSKTQQDFPIYAQSTPGFTIHSRIILAPGSVGTVNVSDGYTTTAIAIGL